MELWGRRRNSILAIVAFTIGWILLSAAQDSSLIVYARAIEGFSRTFLLITLPVKLLINSRKVLDNIKLTLLFNTYSVAVDLVITLISSIKSMCKCKKCNHIICFKIIYIIIVHIRVRRLTSHMIAK
jgi:hypothetical protein